MKRILPLSLALLLFVGCSSKEESFVYQAQPAVQRELTNDVIGYSRTIKIQIDWPDLSMQTNLNWAAASSPTNWTAVATVEFVNKFGGIERTNLHYRFLVSNYYPNHLFLD